MNHFKIACGAVALMTMVMVVYFGRSSSSPEPEPAVALTPAPTLELMQDPEMVKARQELAYAMTMYNEAPTVAAEAVVPQISQKMRDTVVTPPPKETKPKETKEHNPCAGNSRRSHKVWISKYKWRCK